MTSVTTVGVEDASTARLRAVLETVVATTRAVIGGSDRHTLLTDATVALVGHGAFSMAWIGADDDGDGWLERLAVAGDAGGYTDGLAVSTLDIAEGQGPTGTAARTGRPVISHDIATDPLMAPWRERCLANGWRSAASFSLRSRTMPTGVLAVYAPVVGAFSPDETSVLEDLASQIGFAADALADRAERAAAIAARRESESRYRTLVEELDAVVSVIDARTGATFVSQQAEAMFGYPAGEMAQPGFWRSRVVPEDLERVTALWDADEYLTSYDLEYRMRRADGEVIWIDERERSVLDEDGRALRWIAVAIDVTERKRAEEAERERAAVEVRLLAAERERAAAEERLGHVVRLARDLVLLIDDDGRIVDANEAACAAYGYALDEIRKKRIHDLRAPDTIAEIEAQLMAAARPEGVLFDTEHRRKDGTTFPVEVSSKVVEVDGTPYRQSIVRDITERRALESRLAQAARLESLGRLASGVAHDFNNLLWGMALIADEVRRHPDSPSVEDGATELLAAARQGQEMTRALLTFARGGSSERRVVDAAVAVGESARLIERLIGGQVELVTHLPAGLPLVLVDPAGLTQALINLAVNARDAMHDGGTLTLSLRPDDLDATTAEAFGILPGPYLRLDVADTGSGIEADLRDHIFEPFFTTKPVSIGTGLGLAVTYGFVRANGGAITVESEPGHGAVFRIWLPFAAAASTAPTTAADAVQEEQAARRRGGKRSARGRGA